MTYEYYGLRGPTEGANKFPSGMFRVIRTPKSMLLERVTIDGKWVADASLYRHFSGDSDDAVPMTKKQAEEYLAYLQSGEAAKKKQDRIKSGVQTLAKGG